MARFLLCWELGGGLGHAGRFRGLAQELMRRGHDVDVMLRDVVHAGAMLRGLDGMRLMQAPLWLHRAVGLPEPTISLAEILLGNGYLKTDALHGLVSAWRGAMMLSRSDVIVADYAPTAAIAARTLDLPVATVGIGFYLPPDEAPLPPFRTWEPIPPGRIAHFERLALDHVNAVLRDHQTAPASKLADILRGDLPLLCTWPELDHYARGPLPDGQAYFGPTFLPSAGEPPNWPDGDGPKVFAYVRATHPDHAELLRALDARGCRTLCFMPEVTTGRPPPVSSPRIAYARSPVHLGEALPQSRLVVCHGGEATLAQALLAGAPVLLMPTQAEQFLMAMRVEETGAGLNAASRPRPTPFGDMIGALLDDTRHADQAHALAARYQGFTHEAQTAALVEAFETLL